jgi:large subunit ribosomal protein L24
MSLARIRQGDTVMVISGKDKGKTGKVLRVFPELERVTVEKLNMIKRHTKASQTVREGGIIEREQPLHISKVMPLDPATGKPTRIRTKVNDDKSKSRIAVKSGKEIAEPVIEKNT